MGSTKALIRSRHIKIMTYKGWIEHCSGFSAITGLDCTFKSGARVVGCYAHITSTQVNRMSRSRRVLAIGGKH